MGRTLMPKGSRRLRPTDPFAALLIMAAALPGCAGGAAEPEAPAPTPETDAAAAEPGRAEERAALPTLEPDPASLRTAERVELTGLELGTMWTFENPPAGYWQERYDFTVTEDWLEDVRLSAVRYGESCSASFVSPDGLVMTNHHCARECIEAVSTERVDHVEEGFYAPTRDDERVCPGLHLDRVVGIEDVTARVRRAGAGFEADTAITRAREGEREEIVEACEAEGDVACEVVSLYHGGQYQLYRYERISPVKLVFAPELQAGYFGGEEDNFSYPRYALDVAFVRAYRPDSTTAFRTEHWFEWNAEGPGEGDVVFIIGNPGSTSRMATVSQLLYEKEFNHPFTVRFLEEQRDFLRWVASQNPQAERQVREQLFSVQNSLKAYRGQLAGLRDTMLMGRKIRWEARFRDSIEAGPELRAEYGDVWDRIAEIQREAVYVQPRLYANDYGFIGSPHTALAGRLVRYVREAAKPEAQRMPGFGEDSLAAVRSELLTSSQRAPAPISARILAIRLRLAREWLPADDPFIRAAFRAGETPEQAAERLVRGTRVGDVSFRRSLVEGGVRAVESSRDPLIELARVMDDRYRELAPRMDELIAREAVQEERLARALFAVYGTGVPPDATFTLRISDGVVRGYELDGREIPWRTTFRGMYERAEQREGADFELPESFAERREAVDMSAPLDFVATFDITGGNSGSPVIDREAGIVGVAFDSNMQGLPNEFLYRDEDARAVAVHSAGILEALRSVYEADALVAELVGDESAIRGR